VLDILRQEIQLTMTNLGCRSVNELTAEMVRWSMPIGFGRPGDD
jgi:isopentenyl diphosphate isomerase/L-lactate dehydrogenase-like FMN-dependent dehydrogenase